MGANQERDAWRMPRLFAIAMVVTTIVAQGIVEVSTAADPEVALAWSQLSGEQRALHWALAFILAVPLGAVLSIAFMKAYEVFFGRPAT